MARWLVVALSGVTNGGKSTLAAKLLEILPKGTQLIQQDNYFYNDNDPHHIPCPGGIKHHNWDVITAMDMNRMVQDVRAIINSAPKSSSLADSLTLDRESEMSNVCNMCPKPLSILILDGFLLFDNTAILEMCNLRYFITLNRDECWQRRQQRNYDPPDPPGYFDKCVWPMYEQYLNNTREKDIQVTYLDGSVDNLSFVLREVMTAARIPGEITENNGKVTLSRNNQCHHAERNM